MIEKPSRNRPANSFFLSPSTRRRRPSRRGISVLWLVVTLPIVLFLFVGVATLAVLDRTARAEDATPVHIGDNVWLGDHATVLKGVTIGANSVVAARAVVTRDVPANVVVAGNPAQVVKELEPERGFRTRMDYFADPAAVNAGIA